MKSASVILGSAYGDEGKGLMTDYLATPDHTVIRFNGGAQAGHTVQLPDGRRHVFHHYGAGALQGASTNLSRFFIVYPMMLEIEKKKLESLGVHAPTLNIDPRSMITTPYEMMLNQMLEESRGTNRHGSCGLGINETIKRHELFAKLTVQDIIGRDARNVSELTLALNEIRKVWVPMRAKELGIKIFKIWQDRFDNNTILFNFIDDCRMLAEMPEIHFALEADWLFNFGNDDYPIIFEGAQGLLLDEDHPFFPYVTHSHTGLKNVVQISKEAGITSLDVYYMTRAYATRHGQGPFNTEVDNSFEDKTNVPNDWQGSMRFGYLDLDLMAVSIRNDLLDAKSLKINASVVVTCLDQVSYVTYLAHGKLHTSDHQTFLNELQTVVGLPVSHISHGPTRNDVKMIVDNV